MLTLPFPLPGALVYGGSPSVNTEAVDTGGYDFLIGGYGFRLATSTQFPYTRGPEQTITQKFDTSLEPGEQSLAPLPWIKSQASFHAGAGQLNLEQGLTAFQYEQEQVEHIRYDNSLGVDVWTPGVVQRLPDTKLTSIAGGPITAAVAGEAGGFDYVVAGGSGTLTSLKFTSGPDAAPTATAIDLTATKFGGASNCNVLSLCTDGLNYYGLISLVSPVAGKTGYVVTGTIGSASAPTAIYDLTGTVTGAVGWAKARLVAALGASVYELNPAATADSTLPTAAYTYPGPGWAWVAVAESPNGVLVAGTAGGMSAILEMTLDTSSGTPVLSGGSTVERLPVGETIYSMLEVTGSFLAIGSSAGVRVGTFDTYTGALKMGPLSVATTAPVYCVATRDRFIYGGYTNQQADGTTGLVRVDFSFQVDTAGRSAYAPDLRPPSTAATQTGTVNCCGVLPSSGRMFFITPQGIHVEGNGPGTLGQSWMRTSRIRYDTTELKLFKLGSIRGTLDTASIEVIGLTPFGGVTNLGTFGFLVDQNPNEFRLPTGIFEWIQLEFHLEGASAQLNSYGVKAYPAAHPQDIITFTAMCFRDETDRSGLDVTDPQDPRTRLNNVLELRRAGQEVRFIEFTNSGAVATQVLIDDLQYIGQTPPTEDDDFGGYITFKLRTTES